MKTLKKYPIIPAMLLFAGSLPIFAGYMLFFIRNYDAKTAAFSVLIPSAAAYTVGAVLTFFSLRGTVYRKTAFVSAFGALINPLALLIIYLTVRAENWYIYYDFGTYLVADAAIFSLVFGIYLLTVCAHLQKNPNGGKIHSKDGMNNLLFGFCTASQVINVLISSYIALLFANETGLTDRIFGSGIDSWLFEYNDGTCWYFLFGLFFIFVFSLLTAVWRKRAKIKKIVLLSFAEIPLFCSALILDGSFDKTIRHLGGAVAVLTFGISVYTLIMCILRGGRKSEKKNEETNN